jgi:hypothetical protein
MRQSASPMRTAPESEAVQRDLVRLQRGVQRRLQAEVRAHLGTNSPALERYYRDYLRDLRRFHSISTYGALYESVLASDIVLIGDYHTLRQSQEVAHRLLERVIADPRPVCLALEMVLEEHQAHLDAYLAGALSETEFLAAIQYRRNWNFAWSHYKPLLETARRQGVRVVGINHAPRSVAGGIRARDARIAASLVGAMGRQPEARWLVLIGDMHLAANHLPAELDRRLAQGAFGTRRRLIVYQNSDALYWHLAERGAEATTRVVQMGPERYCVLEVPPYVKLQSYLGWEREQDALEEAFGDAGPEPTCAALVEHLVAQLGEFFGLPAVDGACDVFANLDENFFDTLAASESLGDERRREIHLHAFSNRSCFVPELDLAYLPYLSVNHAAEEGMHLMQWRLAGIRPAAADAYQEFYARILWSALGYAASKTVNPWRRATGEDAFREFSREASRALHEPELAFRKLVARFVVQHKDHEVARRHGRRGRLKQVYEQDLEVVLEVCIALGYMLGESLAAALRDGRLGRESMRELVLGRRDEPPATTYFHLVDWLATRA